MFKDNKILSLYKSNHLLLLNLLLPFFMINGIHDFPPHFFQEVKIEKQTEEKLGMLIKGGLHGQPGNPHDESDEGVFIARINPGGHASRRSEELEVGQRIIEVNTFFFLNDLFLYLAIDTVFHPSGIIQNGRRKLLSQLYKYETSEITM